MISWEFLDLLFANILAPASFCVFRVAFLCFTNTLFYSKSLNAYLDIKFFPCATIFIGVINQSLFYSWSYVVFAAITSVVFALILHVSILASKAYNFTNLDIGVRVLLGIYSIIGMRLPLVEDSRYDDYLILYIVLCMKLLCCTEKIDRKRYQILTELHGGVHIHTLEICAYFFYSGWISYNDFGLINMKIKQRKRSKQPWFVQVKYYFFEEVWRSQIMYFTLSKTIVFHLLSQDYIPVEIGLLRLLVQALQFRFKYYLLCQYSEFQRITATLTKKSWDTNSLFNFTNAETSITLRDFFRSFSLPINGYIRRNFNNTTISGQLSCLAHYAGLCFIFGTYNGHYAVVFAFSIVGFFSQRTALVSTAAVHNICLFTCDEEPCNHLLKRKEVPFCALKTVLIIIMNLRFASILPVVPAYDPSASFILVLAGLVLDMYFLTEVLLTMDSKSEDLDRAKDQQSPSTSEGQNVNL